MVRMLFFLPSVQHVEFNVDTSTRYKGTPTQQGTPREFLRRWQYHHLHHVCLHLRCRHSLCACNLWRELITSTSETIRGKGSQQKRKELWSTARTRSKKNRWNEARVRWPVTTNDAILTSDGLYHVRMHPPGDKQVQQRCNLSKWPNSRNREQQKFFKKLGVGCRTTSVA